MARRRAVVYFILAVLCVVERIRTGEAGLWLNEWKW